MRWLHLSLFLSRRRFAAEFRIITLGGLREAGVHAGSPVSPLLAESLSFGTLY